MIFVFAFVFAIVGMAMPANMEDEGVDVGPISQLKNQLKIIVTFTQIFSSVDQIFTGALKNVASCYNCLYFCPII